MTMETHYRCFDDKHGVALDVGPDGDGLGIVELSARDEKSANWFGPVRLVVEPRLARTVGEALIKAADDADRAAATEGRTP